MRLIRDSRDQAGRGFVLLAPPEVSAAPFDQFVDDGLRHQRLLAEAQRLRGRIYVRDGAIPPSELSADGRHIQSADDLAWHLLTVDESEKVTACIRYFAHAPGVAFPELSVAQSGVIRSAELGPRVREAIEGELHIAKRRGFWYVELGGWAVCESLRCTTEAVRTLLTVYALSQVQGGALGLSSATTRHHSSSILRRVGGRSLAANGVEVPSYFDPQYGCEMELLSFDSTCPNERYAGWIGDCRRALREVPVVSVAPPETRVSDLLNLHAAVVDHAVRFTWQPELVDTKR